MRGLVPLGRKRNDRLWRVTAVGWLLWCTVAAAGPVAVFEQTRYDFGFRPPQRPTRLVHNFAFQNAGDRPLTILSLTGACMTQVDCQTRRWAPGQHGWIRVTVDLDAGHAAPGPLDREVEVVTDDPNHPRQQLRIDVRFESSLACEPERLQFGPLNPDQGSTQTLHIESRTTGTFRLGKIESLRGLAEAWLTDPKTTTTSEPLHRATLSVRLRPTSGMTGEICDTLRIATDRADATTLSVPLSGLVRAPLRAEPAEVFLGLIRDRKVLEREVFVRGTGTLSVKGSHPQVLAHLEGLSIIETQPERGGWKIRLRYTPPDREQILLGKVEFELEGETTGSLTIPIRGMIKPKTKTDR